MKTRGLNKINISIFRLFLYLIFGSTTVSGQTIDIKNNVSTEVSTSIMLNNLILTEATDLKLNINAGQPKLKSKINNGTPTLFKPVRLGIINTHFSSFTKLVKVNSGFVYYTLKNPLKRTGFNSSGTPSMGFSIKASF